jgi:hypothetical protein
MSKLGVAVVIVAVALISGFVGWKYGAKEQVVIDLDKFHQTNKLGTADQPIIISDGSLFIHEQDNQPISSAWSGYSGAGVIPSTISPNGTFVSLAVYDSGTATNQTCIASAACQVDISYFYKSSSSTYKPALHFSYNNGTNTMTLTSDYDPFDSWPGYSDYLMYHPRVNQIAAVNVNGTSQNFSSGKVKIKIIRK